MHVLARTAIDLKLHLFVEFHFEIKFKIWSKMMFVAPLLLIGHTGKHLPIPVI